MSSPAANRGEARTNHRLDPARIILTAERLAGDIATRLPGTTLAELARELASLARLTSARLDRTRRPIYAIRIASLAAIMGCLAGLVRLFQHVNARWEFATVTDLFEAADAGFNLLVLLTGALWFLFTIESRLKRREVLQFIGELRDFVHVIDITQLYFTPDLYEAAPDDAKPASRLDYGYLFYCTQMLGVISNLSALFTRVAGNDSIWRAVSEVESLANAIATKLASKTEAVRLMSAGTRRRAP